MFTEFKDQVRRLEEFQKYCVTVQNDDNSEALIASKSAELFILADITGAEIFDETVAEYAAIRDEVVDEVDVFLKDLNFYRKNNPDFVKDNLNDICASIQYTIVGILMDKLKKAVKQTGITHIAIGGGVSANSGIREALKNAEQKHGWTTYIPKFEYTTDNAAMIAIVGYLKYLEKDFSDFDVMASARLKI